MPDESIKDNGRDSKYDGGYYFVWLYDKKSWFQLRRIDGFLCVNASAQDMHIASAKM